LRPIGIPNSRDKIVQQVMVMILEAIYGGGTFSDRSQDLDQKEEFIQL
jgi:retron-type reverse transcriptase